MKRSGHTLFSIFFAILTALVMGLVVTTVLPIDHEKYNSATYERTALWRMLLSQALSTVVLVAGLATPIRLEVFRIGLLLGALTNLVVANFWAWDYDNDPIRLAAAVVSLILAGIAGWWQFNPRQQSKRRRGRAEEAAAAAATGAGDPHTAHDPHWRRGSTPWNAALSARGPHCRGTLRSSELPAETMPRPARTFPADTTTGDRLGRSRLRPCVVRSC